MKVAKAKRRLRDKQPKLSRKQEAHVVSLVRSGDTQSAPAVLYPTPSWDAGYPGVNPTRTRLSGFGDCDTALGGHGGDPTEVD